MVSDDEPGTQMAITAPEVAAVIQLHMWLRIGLDELAAAVAANDNDRAMVIARLLLDQDETQRDTAIAETLADRLFPVLFRREAPERREQLREQLAAMADDVLVELRLRDAANAPPKPRGLPS